MKRRDFILSATGSTSLLYLNPASALAPCPPALVGAAANSPCSIVDAEQDWLSRVNAPGVVWYHDFRSDAEVDNFRWSGGVGNDPQDLGRPNTVRRITTDGITGSCLEIYRPAGGSDGAVWWRPLSPIVGSGNGKGVDDPGANGTISAKSYAATQGGSQIQNWTDGGVYGNESYHAASPGRFDGTEFYFQCRVKMDPNRQSESSGGKLFYFTLPNKSLTSQEIVTESGQNSNGENFFSMYRSGGTPLETDMTPNWDGSNQPGSDLGFCDWPSQVANCWSWSGGWDTMLYRVKPGLDGNSDTIVQVWAAHPGETSYTKIWDMDDADIRFETINGHGALICSAYMNGFNFSSAVFHRYCQLIFSKDFIPCPQF